MKLNNLLWCAWLCVLLSACPSVTPMTGKPLEPVPARLALPVPKPAPPVSLPGEIDTLLAYHESLRDLSPGELAKELASLQTQTKSARLALQKSMVLAMNHGAGDLARAQVHVDGVLKSTEPDAIAIKPLAAMLSANYGELRRLADQTERLGQQAREGQRRIDQLNETLEALKAIERTLPARPNGVAVLPGQK